VDRDENRHTFLKLLSAICVQTIRRVTHTNAVRGAALAEYRYSQPLLWQHCRNRWSGTTIDTRRDNGSPRTSGPL